ncbi:hypothetical protein AMTR_s00077p00017160 [Amborella trichopoda]|uniref:Plant heme peroxidase family profile domain-containing protein n=1 Tax=Amborella trichopoda TaxID=13333 RepID=W1P836_AMBTC|nr:hypothetical protein AMTR_s00077p00017160 [Amborella trichopoda]
MAFFVSVLGFAMVFLPLFAASSADLSSTFYSSSCPKALYTIQTAVKAAVKKEARMGASLLRLHFHDCFVNASITSHFDSPIYATCMKEYFSKFMQKWIGKFTEIF